MTGHGFARVGRRLIRIARPEEVPDPVSLPNVDEEAQTRRILLTVQRACIVEQANQHNATTCL